MNERTRRPPRPKFTKQRPSERSSISPWRLFLAVPLPPDVVDLVDRTIADLRQEEWPIRWTASHNAHITLHFLGEVEPERAQILRLALPAIVSRHQAFALRTADLGVFPKMKRPRVLWLGLYGPAHRLQTLRQAIGETLVDYEFEVEDREFHPHITLGRVRDTRNTRIRDLPGSIRARFELAAESGTVTHRKPLPIPVEEVHLVRSHLERDGPRYEVIERFPLIPDSESPTISEPAASMEMAALTTTSVEVTLHLFVLAYQGVIWSANPHMVRSIHLDIIPVPGASIPVGPRGDTFHVARIARRPENRVVDCYLEDDLTVAVPPGRPEDRVLPSFDESAVTARVRDLEADGWTRSFTPHVRRHPTTTD